MRSAFGLRVGVPIAALQWLGREVERKGKVKNLVIASVPPGIRVGADVDLMHTPIRAAAVVYIERVQLGSDEMVVALRLEEVAMEVLDASVQSPVAALIRSGALDLSRPGNLAAQMPLPPVVAEAKDNRFVLDLMRDPKIGGNALVRAIVGVLTSFVTVHGVETDPSHIDVAFRALPFGVRGAVGAFRRHVVRPSIRRLLPPGF